MEEKYKDTPEAVGKGDPNKRMSLFENGSKVVDCDPKDKELLQSLNAAQGGASVAMSSFIENKSTEMGVPQENKIFVARAAGFSSPSTQEFLESKKEQQPQQAPQPEPAKRSR